VKSFAAKGSQKGNFHDNIVWQLRVISIKKLRDFWLAGNAAAKGPLEAWYAEAERANWKSPGDIKLLYPSASILANNRVVFNVKGNTLRIVVKIHYNTSMVYIRFVGTHADYDKVNAEEV
jgi:mRNA interferase HigB